MVFISLQDVVCNSADADACNMKPFVPSVTSESAMQVVVTPGSPAKKQSSPVLRASLFHLSTQRASSSPFFFVLYVSDYALRLKWVLSKTSVDHAQLRTRIRRAGNECKNHVCCGHLQRIIKKSINTRYLWGSSTHYDHCNKFQSFVTDLVQVVLKRDTPCKAVQRTRYLIEEFLNVKHLRSEAIDRALLNEYPVASPTAASVELSTVRTHGQDFSEASADNPECPICCGDLAHDRTVRLLCGHIYHTGCIRVWLELQPTCPVCRLQLKTGTLHFNG